MSSERRTGRDVGGGGDRFDPSDLHLKKELTQIKKAAKALRDPGTVSSWRSPMNSARSVAAHHYYHHHKNDFRPYSKGEHQSKVPFVGNDSMDSADNNVYHSKEKEKKVYLYNWKMQKSESEKSRQCGNDGVGNGDHNDIDTSSSIQEVDESLEDSLSDARNYGNDSKSDTYVSDKFASALFNCKDASFRPSIRRSFKKKPKKGNRSSSILMSHGQKLRNQIVPDGVSRRAVKGSGRDDLSSLVYQSDGTEDYGKSEDMMKFSAASPLLAKFRNKNGSISSAKLMRRTREEDSSYSSGTLPQSTSSAYRYAGTVGSLDAAMVSFNDADDEVDEHLDFPGRQGCGLPCYWSRRSTPKSRGGSGSCFSPSLSDTLRRTGRKMLCGRNEMHKKRRCGSSTGHSKRNSSSRNAAQGLLPLLTNHSGGQVGSSLGTGFSDDDLSTNFGELDLEALSRLDGKRWSTSCRSQDGLVNGGLGWEEEEDKRLPETIRSLSQKYRPLFFEELVGQNIVIQSLINAISKKRIAPVYLFQGPRGTGKTSTARVFAAALNCLASEEVKPCGICRECTDFVSGKSRDLIEVDGTNKKAISSIRHLIRSLLSGPSSSSFSAYKIFVVEECHLFPAKTWISFLKFLEEPPPRVVFILITTDLNNLPRSVLSRCQKFIFNKIKDSDIFARLKKISAEENLDVESDSLNLIAANADGSLRDAETMLDQLSLLGKRITTSLVNELVGVVSDEKLLELLELAMSSDTAETVKRARELTDSGVDPIDLVSQMGTLIMDIIAGSCFSDEKHQDSLFGGGNLTEAELERLKRALQLLSEAEKQLRVSSDRSTWFTATLLQLGSISSTDPTHSGSSRRQSSKTTEEEPSPYKDSSAEHKRISSQYASQKSGIPTSLQNLGPRKSISKDINSSFMVAVQNDLRTGEILADKSADDETKSGCLNPNMLDKLWLRCVEKCHSKTLRQLLHTYGKLVSISEVQGVVIAYIAFADKDIKSRAERFHSSITNSFETALRCNVEVRIILLPDGDTLLNCEKPNAVADAAYQNSSTSAVSKKENTGICYSKNGHSNDPEEPFDALEENAKITDRKEKGSEVPMQRIESIIREQNLETAWLQAMEKGAPGPGTCSRPERNQVLPQDGIYDHNQSEASNHTNIPSQHWEDELLHETERLKKIDVKKLPQKNQNVRKTDRYPMSPSLLHDNSLVGKVCKENSGYESGPAGRSGCSGLFCWNNSKSGRRIKGTPVRSHKGVRFTLFGECSNRFKR